MVADKLKKLISTFCKPNVTEGLQRIKKKCTRSKIKYSVLIVELWMQNAEEERHHIQSKVFSYLLLVCFPNFSRIILFYCLSEWSLWPRTKKVFPMLWGSGKQAYKTYRMIFFENLKYVLWWMGLGVHCKN